MEKYSYELPAYESVDDSGLHLKNLRKKKSGSKGLICTMSAVSSAGTKLVHLYMMHHTSYCAPYWKLLPAIFLKWDLHKS